MKPLIRHKLAVLVLFLTPVIILAPAVVLSQDHVETGRKVVSRVDPQYPALARAMKIQGSVRADVLVGLDGRVKSIEVKGGHPLLAQAAQNALHDWKWEPAAHETHEIVELKFTL
jgi:periplasmic protein TonB